MEKEHWATGELTISDISEVVWAATGCVHISSQAPLNRITPSPFRKADRIQSPIAFANSEFRNSDTGKSELLCFVVAGVYAALLWSVEKLQRGARSTDWEICAKGRSISRQVSITSEQESSCLRTVHTSDPGPGHWCSEGSLRSGHIPVYAASMFALMRPCAGLQVLELLPCGCCSGDRWRALVGHYRRSDGVPSEL